MEKLMVKFQNIETPGMRLDFTYQGDGYSLEDTGIYELPINVVEHLNNLAVPIWKWEVDVNTGQQAAKRTGVKNRFSCVPVNLGSKKAKPGRKKKE